MVGSPEPHVLKVARRGLRQVHHQTGSRASRVDAARGRRTLCRCQFRSRGASYARVAIPEPGGALRLSLEIPFNEDGTGRWAPGREQKVLHLYIANLAVRSDLDEDFGIAVAQRQSVTDEERKGM